MLPRISPDSPWPAGRLLTCLRSAPLIDYALLVVSPACFARAESRSSSV